MKNLYVLSLLIVIAGTISAQSYNNPESAVYDPVNDQYLISNAGNGTIVAADVNSHSLSNFITTGLNTPKGMTVANGNLYVADVNQVHIISLSSGSITQSVSITDAQQLDDLTANPNGDSLFITDIQADKIFYMTANGANGILSEAGSLDAPNGILFDNDNQLLGVSFISNSPIEEIDRDDGIVSFSMGTALSELDGLTQAPGGTYYVSSWDLDVVLQFPSKYSPPSATDVAVSNVTDPADIYYDSQYDVLIVPEYSANNVKFIDASVLGIDQTKEEEITIYPIPAKEQTTIHIPDKYLNQQYQATIYTLSGQKVQEYSLTQSAITISDLPAATYLVQFQLGDVVKTMKIVFAE